MTNHHAIILNTSNSFIESDSKVLKMELSETDLEGEIRKLIDTVAELQAERDKFRDQVVILEKALDKQKNFHRKFADDVIESERVRNEHFRSEKRSLTEENKSHLRENRDLKKELTFYKEAYHEILQENESEGILCPDQRTEKNEMVRTIEDDPAVEIDTSQRRRSSRRLSVTSTSAQTSQLTASEMVISKQTGKKKSSKVMTKISENLITENKKLKLKVNSQSAIILHLRKDKRQLENQIAKMDKKQNKISDDVGELNSLVESSQLTNADIFTREVLDKLRNYS